MGGPSRVDICGVGKGLPGPSARYNFDLEPLGILDEQRSVLRSSRMRVLVREQFSSSVFGALAPQLIEQRAVVDPQREVIEPCAHPVMRARDGERLFQHDVGAAGVVPASTLFPVG